MKRLFVHKRFQDGCLHWYRNFDEICFYEHKPEIKTNQNNGVWKDNYIKESEAVISVDTVMTMFWTTRKWVNNQNRVLREFVAELQGWDRTKAFGQKYLAKMIGKTRAT